MKITSINSTNYEITSVKLQIKNPNRVNIAINGAYSFSLDIAQLADFKLKTGQHLDQTQLDQLKTASNSGKLYQRTLEWVLTRPRSIKETRDYLHRKINSMEPISEQNSNNLAFGSVSERGVHAPIPSPSAAPAPCKDRRARKASPEGKVPRILRSDQEAIIQKLTKKGYLSDEKYAKYFIENRFAKKGISRRRLEQELHKKGIAQPIIDTALAQTARTDNAEITKIIAKKRPKYTDPQKLIQYLVRQGFDYESAKTAVHETDLQNQT